jgi:hypothetical protein
LFLLKHPVSDELEAYALNRLGPDHDRIIEEHLLMCEECRHRLQRDDGVIDAIRISFPNFDFTHATEDGDIRLWIEPNHGGWTARIEGKELRSLRAATTAKAAIVSISRAFREMFPEHRCNERCCAG